MATVIDGDQLGKGYTELDTPPLKPLQKLLYFHWGCTLAKSLPAYT
jgi:hypothetical protein